MVFSVSKHFWRLWGGFFYASRSIKAWSSSTKASSRQAFWYRKFQMACLGETAPHALSLWPIGQIACFGDTQPQWGFMSYHTTPCGFLFSEDLCLPLHAPQGSWSIGRDTSSNIFTSYWKTYLLVSFSQDQGQQRSADNHCGEGHRRVFKQGRTQIGKGRGRKILTCPDCYKQNGCGMAYHGG